MRLGIATVCVGVMAGTAAAEEVLNRMWTDQGWANRQGAIPQVWYGVSQGSRLIRMDWFLALGQAGAPFAGRAMADHYGYPFMTDDALLPIGFVADWDDDGQQWLGMNCAACHTSRLTYNSTELMIHGGQSYGDFRSFLEDLTASVQGIYDDPQASAAFRESLPGGGGYVDVADLRAELQDWLGHREGIDRILHGLDADQDWGYGRADAVAYIQAATASVVQTERPTSVNPANAPVNYPPAWNANQQGALQHNGLVENGTDLSVFDSNVKIGAYIRNWTEALGVFADAEMDPDGTLRTSIRGPQLLEIEKALATLQSPVWPEAVLGAIDGEAAARGAVLYDQHCIACHGIVADPGDLAQLYPLESQVCSTEGSRFGRDPFVCVQPVVGPSVTRQALEAGVSPSPLLAGTDPMMTCNIMLHQIATGKLEGGAFKDTFLGVFGGTRFTDYDFTNQVMAALILKDLANQAPELLEAQLEAEGNILIDMVKTWFGLDAQVGGGLRSNPGDIPYADALLADCASGALALNSLSPEDFPLPGYKSRPLNGIWATPPYLHNGSVPSLYDLLRPPQDRPTVFNVPDGAFDPVFVGMAQDAGGFVFNVRDAEGNIIVGNSNAGHVYGVEMTPADRMDLVEYLKGL